MRLVTLRRLSRWIAIVPLLAYLVFHAWEHWPVRAGRDAVLARLEHSSNVWLELVLVVVPLLVHAALGLALARREEGAPVYISRRHRGLQVATGVVALAFVVFHGSAVWLPKFGAILPLNASYNAAREQTGSVLGVSLYVLGLGAVCTHVGQGVGAALLAEAPEVIGVRAARALGVLVGVGLYLAFVCELAVYSSGAALL